MDGRRRRLVGATALVVAAAGLTAAPAAMAAGGISVASISALQGRAGTLTGTVVNDTNRTRHARVIVSLHRRATTRSVVGRTAATVKAHGSAGFTVAVKLPARLANGAYSLSACTPAGKGAGTYGCATARDDIQIGAAKASRAKAAQAPADCTSGARTLSKPGMRVYPETGNGGYQSVHSDVVLTYDAPTNTLLPGTHVDLTQKATQCLTDLSVDFERANSFVDPEQPEVT